MSEIPNMISSLVDDNKIDAETHFKNSIAQKIGSALDLKRVEVANSLIKGQLNTSVGDSADEEI
ncbi:MAG TPA: hypothetical protein QF480_08770 [Bacteroidales bacterium]|nr:hypothetical protein [Bacteroidales bacterium]